ncbi:MAG TPA: response regulator transcription factor [Chitinophagaceae bacterium]|nr:response regulator transcription factor [Chitinophagaceae bacterium]
MSEIKILIVEDEPVIAQNISMYLNNNDFTVSGIAYDYEEAMSQLQHNPPDAVILDINLDSEQDGIDIASHINKKFRIPFLFLTSYSNKETLQRAKAVEPSGYIVKPFNERTLLASLEIAISNFSQRSNQQVPALHLEKINKHLLSPLTDREFAVMELIYAGKTNNQLAAELFVSLNTVKVHIKNAYLKLDAPSRTKAIARLRDLMQK